VATCGTVTRSAASCARCTSGSRLRRSGDAGYAPARRRSTKRPVVIAESTPYRVVVVGRDRVTDPDVLHGPADVTGVCLEREVGCVHADRHVEYRTRVMSSARTGERSRALPVPRTASGLSTGRCGVLALPVQRAGSRRFRCVRPHRLCLRCTSTPDPAWPGAWSVTWESSEVLVETDCGATGRGVDLHEVAELVGEPETSSGRGIGSGRKAASQW